MPTHTTLDQAVFLGLTLPLAVMPALVLTRPRWCSFIAVASTTRPKRVAKCVDSAGAS